MVNLNNLSSPIKYFSNRETEILILIINEYTTPEIATELFLSKETIKSHRANIMRKLCVKNVAGIVREAFMKNLISVPVQNFA